MDYLPVKVQMKDKRCLIVGGGDIAAKKLKHLLKLQSQVVMLSDYFSKEVEQLAKANNVRLILGRLTDNCFASRWMKDVYLVVAANDVEQLNCQVSKMAKSNHMWVNVVNNMALSTFILPSDSNHTPLLVTVSSSAASCLLLKRIGEKIEWVWSSIFASFEQKLK